MCGAFRLIKEPDYLGDVLEALERLAEIEMHELRDPLMRHSRGGDDGDAKSAGLTRLERLHKAFAAFVARGVDFFAAARRTDLSAPPTPRWRGRR